MKHLSVIRYSVTAALLTFALGACGDKKKEAGGEATPTPAAETTAAATAPAAKEAPAVDKAAAEAEAKTIFETRCVACHGSTGKGDGPGAAAITPKPRDYTSSEWQASVSDEDIIKTIISGGLAVGKSAVMPGNPDLKGKDEVLKAIVGIIRDFEE